MIFAKTLADTYGISEDNAILLAATWHRQTTTQDELRECKYSHDLPKRLAELVVTSTARRAINEGVLLKEDVDRISNLEVFPTENEISEINEKSKTHFFKHWTAKEIRLHFQ